MTYLDLFAGAVIATLAGLLIRFLLWAVKRGVREVVDERLTPLAHDLREHMRNEEDARRELLDAIGEVKSELARNEVEHASFDQRLRRLES